MTTQPVDIASILIEVESRASGPSLIVKLRDGSRLPGLPAGALRTMTLTMLDGGGRETVIEMGTGRSPSVRRE